jgi:hypothetical protein
MLTVNIEDFLGSLNNSHQRKSSMAFLNEFSILVVN